MPFTQEEFLHVFARYNTEIWPAQVIIYLTVLAALWLIPGKTKASDMFAGIVLAMMWILAGAGYHIAYFSAINTAAYMFGMLFILQGMLFLVSAVKSDRLHFEYKRGAAMWVGWSIVIYAMLIYPLLGNAFGHRYPESPMFGVAPCPVTIFTFGVLLWSTRGLRRYLLIIPAIWSLIGFTAALKFGIYQDYGLLLAGLIAVPLILKRHRP